MNRTKIRGGVRNYSLDLLRIISMLMVVSLHSASHGGLMHYYSIEFVNGLMLRFINILCVVAVNVYVLIGGYFLSAQEFRLSRLIKLALEVMFYAWLILSLSVVRGSEIGMLEFLSMAAPISYGIYWFVTAYVGMLLLSPLLNRLLATLNRAQHLMVVIALLAASSVHRDLFIKSDPFAFNQGYSLLWFIVIYVIASYIRHYLDSSRIKRPLLYYFVLCCIMMASWVLMKLLADRFAFIDQYELTGYWTRYNSILNISAAVMLFVAFLKREIKGKAACKVISVIAPLTFGVYLIHDNPWVRDFVWFEVMKTNTYENNVLLIPRCLAAVLAVFAGCLVIDYLRTQLFHLFDRRTWYQAMMGKIDGLPEKICDKLGKSSP